MAKGQGFGRDYPRGRISGDDEGSTSMAIAHDPSSNTLIIRFPQPTEWIGLGPDEVANLVMMLAKHLSTMKGVPVSVSIDTQVELPGSDPEVYKRMWGQDG